MRRWLRAVAMAWAGAGLALAAPPHAADAQAAAPTVTMAPPSVSVPSDGEVPAAIVATNPTTQAIRVSFGDVHAPGVVVNVAIAPGEARSPVLPTRVVPPGSSLRWDMSLRRSAGGALPSRFVVTVRVVSLDDGPAETGPVRESLLVADLAAVAPEGTERVVTVDLRTAVTRVDDLRKGDVHLVLRNVSAGPVTATATARKHDHVDVRARGPGSVVVQAGQDAVLTYEVQGHRRIQSGPTTVVFDIALRWGNVGQERSGNVVATHKFDLGVFGDSEFTNLVAVPLLLLPGVLALAAVSVFWRLGVRLSRSNEATFPLAFKSAEYWLIALGVAAWWLGFYAWRTGATWATALSVYGSGDVVRLVLWAVPGSVLLYCLACTVGWLVRRKRVPAAGDGQLQLLSRRGKASVWSEVATEKDGTAQWFVVGENWRRTKLVVAPAVLVSFTQTDPATQSLEEQVLAQLERDGSAAALVDLLRPATEAGQVVLTWRPANARVLEVDAARVVRGIGRDAPVVVV